MDEHKSIVLLIFLCQNMQTSITFEQNEAIPWIFLSICLELVICNEQAVAQHIIRWRKYCVSRRQLNTGTLSNVKHNIKRLTWRWGMNRNALNHPRGNLPLKATERLTVCIFIRSNQSPWNQSYFIQWEILYVDSSTNPDNT